MESNVDKPQNGLERSTNSENINNSSNPVIDHQSQKMYDDVELTPIQISPQNSQHIHPSSTTASTIDDNTHTNQSLSTTKLSVALSNVTASVSILQNSNPSPNIFSPFQDGFTHLNGFVRGKSVTTDFFRLKNVSGYFPSGCLVLILAPPGAGKSTYLKSIAQSISIDKQEKVDNENYGILYNGLTPNKAKDMNIDLKKLIQYVEQTDLGLPMLTCLETLQFANQMASSQYSEEKVQEIISELGLTECQHTLVGNQLIKGLSGGQKRRLSLGVALASDAVCLCLDQFTDGLDSSVAEKIVLYLSGLCRSKGLTIITTMQQPTPAAFQCFDKIVLLREGEVVYDGPKDDVLSYLDAMGYPASDDVDTCDYIIDVLSQPRMVLQTLKLNEIQTRKHAEEKEQQRINKIKSLERRKTKTTDETILKKIEHELIELKSKQTKPTHNDIHKAPKFGQARTLQTSLGPIQCSTTPAVTTEEMVEFYHTTPFASMIRSQVDAAFNSPPALNDTSKTNDITTTDTTGTKHDNTINPTPTPTTQQDLTDSQHIQHQPLITRETKSKFSTGYRQPVSTMFKFVFSRQIKLTVRNKSLIISRLMNCLVMSFIYSAMYYFVPVDQYRYRVAAILLAVAQVIFNSMSELAPVNSTKPVLQAQFDSSLFPQWMYTVSLAVVSVPYILLETMIYTLIFYFMEGFYRGFREFAIYYCFLVLTQLCAAAWYRLVAIGLPDLPSAIVTAASSSSFFLTFCGFYIPRSSLPQWLIWLYWGTPFSWIVRAMVINEFQSPRYDAIITNALNPPEQGRMGDLFLEYIEFYSNPIWMVWGAVFAIGFIIIAIVFQSLCLKIPGGELSRGTRRVIDTDDGFDLLETEAQNQQRQEALNVMNTNIIRDQQQIANEISVSRSHNNHQQPQKDDHTSVLTQTTTNHHDDFTSQVYSQLSAASSAAHASKQLSQMNQSIGGKPMLQTLAEKLPFSPTHLSFHDITYTVQVKTASGDISDKILLRSVSGLCKPGNLMALMGASGAGKTTLLDVISGRKTTGTIDGKILLNGVEATKQLQDAMTGYVEQFDSLFPYSSVEETLLYCARLRLPASIDDSIRHIVVQEILEVLELTPLRHFIVSILSPSQRKLVSIGLELVANPSVIFFDEPTTGLDSRSASVVLRAIRRIARSGRTCIVTIHQPAAELFFMFDSLILMAPGGNLVFSGQLGFRCRSFVKYFSSIPGLDQFPARSNPSTWMLDQSSKDPLKTFETEQATIIKQLMIDFNITQDEWDQLKPNQRWIQFLKWYYIHHCKDYGTINTELTALHNIYLTSIGLMKATPISNDTPNNDTNLTSEIDGDENNINTNETQTKTENIPQQDQPNNDIQPTTQTTTSNEQPITSETFITAIKPHELPSTMRQIYLMTCRQFNVYFRNQSAIINRTLVVLISTLLNGLIYYNTIPTDTASLLSFCSAYVISTASTSMSIGTGSMAGYLQMKPIFYREIRGFYSSPSIWGVGVFVNEILWAIPYAFLQSIPIYFLVGINKNRDTADFFHFVFTTFTTILIYLSAMSAFSSISPNVPIAQMFAGLLGGLGFAVNGIAATYAQLRKISGFHSALFFMFPLGPTNFKFGTFLFDNAHAASTQIQVIINNALEYVSLKDYAAQYFGWNYDLGWAYWGIMMAQLVFWQIVYHLGLRFLNFSKR